MTDEEKNEYAERMAKLESQLAAETKRADEAEAKAARNFEYGAMRDRQSVDLEQERDEALKDAERWHAQTMLCSEKASAETVERMKIVVERDAAKKIARDYCQFFIDRGLRANETPAEMWTRFVDDAHAARLLAVTEADEMRKEIRRLREESGRVEARITTIADEANGPHPVQGVGDSLSEIEHALFRLRQWRQEEENRADKAEDEVAALRARVEAARKGFDKIIAIDGFVIEVSGGRHRAAFTFQARDIAKAALSDMDAPPRQPQAQGEPCHFSKPYYGECGNLDCTEHKDLICHRVGCGNSAVRGCEYAVSLVCGYPVCAEHRYCDHHKQWDAPASPERKFVRCTKYYQLRPDMGPVSPRQLCHLQEGHGGECGAPGYDTKEPADG